MSSIRPELHSKYARLCGISLVVAFMALPQVTQAAIAQEPTCSIEYNLQADLPIGVFPPNHAQNSDFMSFSWNHFLALNATEVGGTINPFGDNKTLWSEWSSTADLLNQTDPGPSGSRFYPEVCQAIPNYENYRVIQQVGKVDDSFLEAQTNGLSEDPVIDSAGKFLRYEIMLSPAAYNQVVASGWNDPNVLANLTTDIKFNCGFDTYMGGDPADPQMGAIVLKIAWRESPPNAAENYHTEDLLIFSPGYRNQSGQDTCELKNMSMVGFHMGHKTEKQPNWIWATWEHQNNAPNCTSQPGPPGPPGSRNSACPVNPGQSSFNPGNCATNEACAACNAPPNSNGNCVNPYTSPTSSVGWCLDLPPNPQGGYSQLCTQVPYKFKGYCSDTFEQCDLNGDDCSQGAECLGNYPASLNQSAACQEAIIDAGEGAISVWAQYDLVSAQWTAQDFAGQACQNAQRTIYPNENNNVNFSILREQVTTTSGAQRPVLGNTSMESYDKANCLGCHAKTYLNGVCENDSTMVCTDNKDCGTGNTCQQFSTDLMYFLKLEVAQPPALRFADQKLKYYPANERKGSDPKVKLKIRSKLVVAGQVGSKDDPRCHDSESGTVKAQLRFLRDDFALDGGVIDLPCDGWKLRSHGRFGPTYAYKGDGLCSSVVIDDDRSIKAVCSGSSLPKGLVGGPEDSLLQVMLVTGRARYCAHFEGVNRDTELGDGSQPISLPAGERPVRCPAL